MGDRFFQDPILRGSEYTIIFYTALGQLVSSADVDQRKGSLSFLCNRRCHPSETDKRYLFVTPDQCFLKRPQSSSNGLALN